LIGDGMRIVSRPEASLHDAHALLPLPGEEKITDARIPRLYHDALQIAISNGDQERAKDFAERAYAAQVILEGEDSCWVHQLVLKHKQSIVLGVLRLSGGRYLT
jgi:hypothetical protein